jgi:hypothetical protein
MGGFHLFQHHEQYLAPDTESQNSKPLNPYEDDIPYHPLGIDDLTKGTFHINVPSKEEIQDRSKSDWLAKGLVLVQITWFVMQCIARAPEKLPLTELEIVTLAYAMMNFGTYVCWWHKPLNVDRPVRVYEKSASDRRDGRLERGATPHGSRLPQSICMQLVFGLGKGIRFLVGIQDGDVKLSDKDKVPTFWSGNPTGPQVFHADIITLLVGLVFGAIHCIAWHFTFASHTEVILSNWCSFVYLGVLWVLVVCWPNYAVGLCYCHSSARCCLTLHHRSTCNCVSGIGISEVTSS